MPAIIPFRPSRHSVDLVDGDRMQEALPVCISSRLKFDAIWEVRRWEVTNQPLNLHSYITNMCLMPQHMHVNTPSPTGNDDKQHNLNYMPDMKTAI